MNIVDTYIKQYSEIYTIKYKAKAEAYYETLSKPYGEGIVDSAKNIYNKVIEGIKKIIEKIKQFLKLLIEEVKTIFVKVKNKMRKPSMLRKFREAADTIDANKPEYDKIINVDINEHVYKAMEEITDRILGTKIPVDEETFMSLGMVYEVDNIDDLTKNKVNNLPFFLQHVMHIDTHKIYTKIKDLKQQINDITTHIEIKEHDETLTEAERNRKQAIINKLRNRVDDEQNKMKLDWLAVLSANHDSSKKYTPASSAHKMKLLDLVDTVELILKYEPKIINSIGKVVNDLSKRVDKLLQETELAMGIVTLNADVNQNENIFKEWVTLLNKATLNIVVLERRWVDMLNNFIYYGMNTIINAVEKNKNKKA